MQHTVFQMICSRAGILSCFVILGNFADVAFASQEILEWRPFLNCAIKRYGEVQSQQLVNAQYQRSIASSAFQFGLNGDAAFQVTAPTQGEATTDSLSYDVSISKPLVNHAASLKVKSSDSAYRAANAEFRSGLMDHLLLLNSATLRIRTLLIEKEIASEQVKQLTELHQFAERLRKSRVIDPADALLVNENLIRFQLRLIEVDEELAQAIADFEVRAGVSKSKLRLSVGALEFSAKRIDLDFQKAVTSIKAVDGKRDMLPPVLAASDRATAFELELKSNDRMWYPTLLAGAGFRRALGSLSSTSFPSESYLGLGLKFELPIDERFAEMERSRALRAIAMNQIARSKFDLKSIVDAKADQLKYLKSQYTVAQGRLKNLERLLDLQLIKFKSGKLSFLNVNDVMLSLLEARRQLASSRARINTIEMDGQIMSILVEPLDLAKMDCPW